MSTSVTSSSPGWRIGVEYDLPLATPRQPDLVTRLRYRGEVGNAHDGGITIVVPSHERVDAVSGIIGIEPLESARLGVASPERRPVVGDLVEATDQIVHATM